MNRCRIFFSFFALSLLPLLACDKATPVAPEGATLTLSANPSRIGLNGTSTITVVGRKPDGNPLNPGTEIRFSTDRGTITPSIASVENGVATAILRGDGRSGTAKVTASTGAIMAVTTDVQIGESTDTKPSLLLSANPNDIRPGETSTITVIARSADGSPVAAGQTVILTSTLGTLDPGRPVTGADGTATSKLTAGTLAGTATVTAVLGSSDAATTMVTIRDLAATLVLSASQTTVELSEAGKDITLTAAVFNAQGQPLANAPVTFKQSGGGSLDRALATTSSDGTATVKLTLNNANVPSGTSVVTVEAATPSVTGGTVKDSVVITITGNS